MPPERNLVESEEKGPRGGQTTPPDSGNIPGGLSGEAGDRNSCLGVIPVSPLPNPDLGPPSQPERPAGVVLSSGEFSQDWCDPETIHILWTCGEAESLQKRQSEIETSIHGIHSHLESAGPYQPEHVSRQLYDLRAEWDQLQWKVICCTHTNVLEASIYYLDHEFSPSENACELAQGIASSIANGPWLFSEVQNGLEDEIRTALFESTFAERSHGDGKGRSSAVHFDISDNHSSSSSNDWAIPYHFGAVEDGPSLDESYAFGPETLCVIETASPRDEVALETIGEIERPTLRDEVALDDMD